MKFSIKNIQFSRYDIGRGIILPEELTLDLAELIGIVFGDGSIYMKNNRYELCIYGDIKEDSEYHREHIKELIKKLFNVEPKTKEHHFKRSNVLRTKIESKAIISFLVKVLGLPSGKKENIIIPNFISNSNKEIICSFLRGLADTDFTIKFKTRYGKKNYYPIIIGNFSGGGFVKQLKVLLKKVGFHSHIENRKKYNKEYKKTYQFHAINVVGKKNTEKWMQNIGFTNKRHSMRYRVWEKIGSCPPYTNIEKAELILNQRQN